MIKNNYFTDNADLQLQFQYLIKFQEVIDEYENGFEDAKKYSQTGEEQYALAPQDYNSAKEYYYQVLESFGDITGNYVSQEAAKMDKKGLTLEDGKVIFSEEMVKLWNMVKDAGLLPFTLKREYKGLGLPVTVFSIIMELLSRADVAFGMSISMLNLAETIEKFASKEVKDKWIPKMVASEYTGAMALSEPNYGSDLSSVMTKAIKQEDGTYLLNGTKRFITHGCGMSNFPAAILTLARTGEAKNGARGLSFFVVDGKTVQVAGIEHKLGIKSSPTCEIVYENSIGEIIGEEGYGLTKYAMGMMNAARLGTGMFGVGVATAAYEEAKKYASEREQFGKLIQDIPAVKKMLDRKEREIVAMRCLNMEAAFSIDMYRWRQDRLEERGASDREIRKDEKIKYWEKLASIFTPICKYYCSEMGNRIAYDSMQVHGGVGFTEEFDVAKLYRDVRILTIYEGTTQLQVIASIGGIISGMTEKGILRDYLVKLMKQIEASELSKNIFSMLENSINLYKELKEKEYYSFEVVETNARLLTGLLLERSIVNLKENANERRKQMSKDFNIESLAIAKANLVKLENAV